MPDRYSTLRQSLIDGVLTTPGDTTPDLRRRVEARAAQHAGIERQESTEVPVELAGYLDKTALHAYKVMDEDIQALKDKGYSEDAILELTLSVALGSGMSRLERGLAALKGATS